MSLYHLLSTDRLPPASPSAMVVGTVLAVGGYYLYKKARSGPTRSGDITCTCGKVFGKLTMQSPSYKVIEVTSMMCCCKDCTNFAQDVLQKGGNNTQRINEFLSPGVTYYLIFNDEIELMKGHEYVNVMSYKKGANKRIYASCCGTPLACIPPEGPGNCLIYNAIIHPPAKLTDNNKDNNIFQNMVPFPAKLDPAVCMYASRLENKQDQEALKKLQKETTCIVASGGFAPYQILKMIARMLFILPFSKGSSHSNDKKERGFLVSGTNTTITIGLESIPYMGTTQEQ